MANPLADLAALAAYGKPDSFFGKARGPVQGNPLISLGPTGQPLFLAPGVQANTELEYNDIPKRQLAQQLDYDRLQGQAQTQPLQQEVDYNNLLDQKNTQEERNRLSLADLQAHHQALLDQAQASADAKRSREKETQFLTGVDDLRKKYPDLGPEFKRGLGQYILENSEGAAQPRSQNILRTFRDRNGEMFGYENPFADKDPWQADIYDEKMGQKPSQSEKERRDLAKQILTRQQRVALATAGAKPHEIDALMRDGRPDDEAIAQWKFQKSQGGLTKMHDSDVKYLRDLDDKIENLPPSSQEILDYLERTKVAPASKPWFDKPKIENYKAEDIHAASEALKVPMIEKIKSELSSFTRNGEAPPWRLMEKYNVDPVTGVIRDAKGRVLPQSGTASPALSQGPPGGQQVATAPGPIVTPVAPPPGPSQGPPVAPPPGAPLSATPIDETRIPKADLTNREAVEQAKQRQRDSADMAAFLQQRDTDLRSSIESNLSKIGNDDLIEQALRTVVRGKNIKPSVLGFEPVIEDTVTGRSDKRVVKEKEEPAADVVLRKMGLNPDERVLMPGKGEGGSLKFGTLRDLLKERAEKYLTDKYTKGQAPGNPLRIKNVEEL